MLRPLEINLKAIPSEDINKISTSDTINSNPVKFKFRIKTDKVHPTKNESEVVGGEIKSGKWSKEEHMKFLNACMNHGNNWFKIQQEVRTRTSAQIRSHAQKYVIKLCKKYQIKLKSKKFHHRGAKHLDAINSMNKNTKTKCINPKEKRLLDMFNYYNREYKPFLIEKSHKNHADEACDLHYENLKTARIVKKQIFFIKKTMMKNRANFLEDKKQIYELEKLKTFNQIFLNKIEFSYSEFNSNIFNDLGTYSKNFNPNFLDTRELFQLCLMKKNVEEFESKLNTYHLMIQDFCKQIEIFFRTDCK